MAKLSLIVPVYNVAPYLRKCVDSLLAQDYDDYEIILVDDGSTDESSAICDEYAASSLSAAGTSPFSEADHSIITIRVIHQPNAGLSAARNAGIKCANGEYLCFVDSDDYWEPKVLGSLMAQVERENLDVLRFDYQNVRVVGGHESIYEVFEPYKNPHRADSCTEVMAGEMYLNTRMGYECYAVMFIIRKMLLIDNGCFFTEGIYFEDTEWTPRMMVRAQRVNATPKVVYNYLTRIGSITKRYDKEHIQKKIESLMKVNISLQNLLRIVQDSRWIKGCIADNVYGIMNTVSAYTYNSAQFWIDTIKANRMLPLQGYKVRKITLLRYGIINVSPRLYCWLRHIRMNYIRK